MTSRSGRPIDVADRSRRRMPQSPGAIPTRRSPGSSACWRGFASVAHNLAHRPVTVRVPDIGAHAGQLVDLFHAEKYGAPELDGLDWPVTASAGSGSPKVTVRSAVPRASAGREAHCVITSIEGTG